MHQSKRIAASSFISAGLLLVAAVGAVASADGVASQSLEGAGLGAMVSAALAMAIVDAGIKQFDSQDGSSRMPMVLLGLAGLCWGMVRIGLQDPWIIPAMAGLLWLTMQAAFFTEPVDDPDESEALSDPQEEETVG